MVSFDLSAVPVPVVADANSADMSGLCDIIMSFSLVVLGAGAGENRGEVMLPSRNKPMLLPAPLVAGPSAASASTVVSFASAIGEKWSHGAVDGDGDATE